MTSAQFFVPVVEKLGNVFNLRVLWHTEIVTIEPDHIKVCGGRALQKVLIVLTIVKANPSN
jgi:hypothetical protein